MTHKTYTALFGQAKDGGWSGYVPDLPTILVGAATLEEAQQLMREAIELHMEDLREQGLPIPPPETRALDVEVEAA